MEMNRISSLLESLSDIGELGIGKTSSKRIVSSRVHEDDSTILVNFCGGVVSLILDVSGKEADLSSDIDALVAVVFGGCEMLELESFVKLKHWVLRIRVVDTENGPLFGFSTIETSGSNGDFLTCDPIDWHRESNGSGSWFRGGVHGSPGWDSHRTVHIQDTVRQTNALVTEQWQVGIVEHTVHSDCKLGGIREFLSSDLHSTIADQNVMSVEISVVIWITFIWSNYKLTLNNKEIELWSLIDIHVEVETRWNVDRFSCHGSKLHAPSGVVRPVVDIGEQKGVGSDVAFVLDRHDQRRRNVAWSFGC